VFVIVEGVGAAAGTLHGCGVGGGGAIDCVHNRGFGGGEFVAWYK